MSEFMFGVSREKPTRKAAKLMNRIAERHGAYLVEVQLPGTGYQRWFAGPNRGNPFDEAMARAVYDDIAKEVR
jgi:hypothetical protein